MMEDRHLVKLLDLLPMVLLVTILNKFPRIKAKYKIVIYIQLDSYFCTAIGITLTLYDHLINTHLLL